MATLLDGVNRILRLEGVISGDDDDAESLTDTQHQANINLAKLAVQDQLMELVADEFIPYEEADAYITLVTDQRTYTLASDFVRFQDEFPFLLEVDAATSTGVSQGNRIFDADGGEEQLRRVYLDYRTQTGDPIWFYPTGGTSRTIGVYPVPDSDANGKIYRYDYQKSVQVSDASDVVPLQSDNEFQAFIEAAARRFKYLRMDPERREALFPNGVTQDPVVLAASARLAELKKFTKSKKGWGKRYFTPEKDGSDL